MAFCVRKSWMESRFGPSIIWMVMGACAWSLRMSARSKALARPVAETRSKLACSTSARSHTKKGISVTLMRQFCVGWMSTISLLGVPLKPSTRQGASNLTAKPWSSQIFSILAEKFLKWLSRRRFMALWRCSSSSSSGSKCRRRALSSAMLESTTSVKTCTSWCFFLPTMMGFLRLKCSATMVSSLQGCMMAWRTLEYIMSRYSPRVDVKRMPLACASRWPMDLRPESCGRSVTSARRGARWSLRRSSRACSTRSASSASLASRERTRLRSSLICRKARRRFSFCSDRKSISLMKMRCPPCFFVMAAMDGGVSLVTEVPP
mmetsp:Transcript_8002/g.22833  ORF Transcript_8002/g.22833 Transcript_8002/m.22833 type:complete len:320 (+) Transcript_8002:197-1156(+)